MVLGLSHGWLYVDIVEAEKFRVILHIAAADYY